MIPRRCDPALAFRFSSIRQTWGGVSVASNPLSGSLFPSSGKMVPLGSDWRVRDFFPPHLLNRVFKQVRGVMQPEQGLKVRSNANTVCLSVCLSVRLAWFLCVIVYVFFPEATADGQLVFPLRFCDITGSIRNSFDKRFSKHTSNSGSWSS